MKFFLALLFCGIIATALSAVSPPSDYLDAEHPGKCLYESHSVEVGVHDNLDASSCYRFSCLEGGKGTLETCGSESPPPDCKFGDFIDIAKDYPECCKKHIECVK